jgi:hypothetical protein
VGLVWFCGKRIRRSVGGLLKEIGDFWEEKKRMEDSWSMEECVVLCV